MVGKLLATSFLGAFAKCEQRLLTSRLPACLPARLPTCLPACPSVRPSVCIEQGSSHSTGFMKFDIREFLGNLPRILKFY
jgi:hypothetical protein